MPEYPFVDEPILFGTPDPLPPPPLPAAQQEAQAKLDAIYSDRGHPFHRGDQKAVDEVLALTRQSLGEAGRKVEFQTWRIDRIVNQSVGAPADSPSSPGVGVSDPPAPSGTANPQTEAPVTTPETFLELADEVELPKEEAARLIALEGRQPSGQFTKERALHNFNPVESDELERLHAIGFARLPLSLQLHLERRSTQFAPGIFSRIVEFGAQLESLDEEITKEAETNPGGQRLQKLVAMRHGRQSAIIF